MTPPRSGYYQPQILLIREKNPDLLATQKHWMSEARCARWGRATEMPSKVW